MSLTNLNNFSNISVYLKWKEKLTFSKQHFHDVRITLPGSSVQRCVSQFILKYRNKVIKQLWRYLTPIHPTGDKLRTCLNLKVSGKLILKSCFNHVDSNQECNFIEDGIKISVLTLTEFFLFSFSHILVMFTPLRFSLVFVDVIIEQFILGKLSFQHGEKFILG